MLRLETATRPPKIMSSVLGAEVPRQRAADIKGIVSLGMRDLFPEIPREIYLYGDDLSAVRKATEEALAGVDTSMIRTQDTVNVLCSETGFNILGGDCYAEMLKTIKDIIEERTGCKKIRLRLCAGAHFSEAREMIPHYKLDKYFHGKAVGACPFDKGVPIETEIGTLYGLARVYDADWFIHAHYDDPREIYLHRLIDRPLKAFAMSYARLETRSVFHMNFGIRSSNIVPRAIFDSKFVQQKFAFACVLMTSPAGIIGVDADRDMDRLNRRLTVNTLKSFGKLLRLFAEIDQCVAVLDSGRWPFYLHAGGLTSGNLFMAPTDYLDLEVGSARKRMPKTFNPAIKALVINYSWREAFWELAQFYPIIVAGRDLVKGLPKQIVSGAEIAEDIENAMERAYRIAKTDKAIIFDGSYGSINLSPALGEFMIEKAPEISREVDQELLPMWLRQRGIDPQEVCV